VTPLPTGARIVVLTKAGCHLCDAACATVRRVADDLDVAWQAYDIADDSELSQRWSEFVPVILIDGAVHGWFRVDEPRLRAALA
jgi:glutaredoxin